MPPLGASSGGFSWMETIAWKSGQDNTSGGELEYVMSMVDGVSKLKSRGLLGTEK